MGFRFFVQRVAGKLGLVGYVKNLRDGRVEIYAIGTRDQLRAFGQELRRGPRAASVSEVYEEDTEVDPRYTAGFSIERDSW